MKEKAEVLRNDRRANTMHGRTSAELDLENTGRHARANTVIGVDGPVQYPMAAPNWSADPTGVEPPLGFDVNAVEPVGESHEIQTSLAAVDAPSDGVPSPTADVERAAATPTPKPKGRV
jgi:hypothetical protein